MHNAVVVIVLTCVVLPIIAYSPLEKKCSNKKLLSFNAGLAPSSAPYVDERRPFLVPELRKLNSDVICLQDVYYGSDVKNTALHLMFSGYPYSYSSLHDERGRLKWGLIQSKPCNGDVNVETTLECLDHVCKKDFHTVEDRLHCGVKHCKLLDLTDNCISCILVSGMDDVTNKCVDGMSATQINIPGLMILSKKPFLTTKRVQFFPEARLIFSNEYLQADIYGLGEVICTHLTNNNSRVKALLDTFYLDGETQNLVETMKLLRSLQNKKDVLLMGNLNTGPSIPSEGVEAKSQFSFTQFMQNNLRSPYAEIVGKPTICPDGNAIADDNAAIVDHILTKGYKIEDAEVQRVLDKNLPGKDYPLSKHYGVQVTVETNCDHDDESINH